MACVAGLWWDQAKRMCASPSEVKCNPYEIINSQGNGKKTNNNTRFSQFIEIKYFYVI
jgi:hypothetical protein